MLTEGHGFYVAGEKMCNRKNERQKASVEQNAAKSTLTPLKFHPIISADNRAWVCVPSAKGITHSLLQDGALSPEDRKLHREKEQRGKRKEKEGEKC